MIFDAFGGGWVTSELGQTERKAPVPATIESDKIMKLHTEAPPARRILLASLIGTTIEFFDFYIYATAAVLVFPKLFFPGRSGHRDAAVVGDICAGVLCTADRFGIVRAFRRSDRPQGHLGDGAAHHGYFDCAHRAAADLCIHRRLAPGLLALCRIGQGLGLGGEWGGAVLLATENAPPGKLAWYGSFPQLGAPLGFLFSNGAFLFISTRLSPAQLFSWGWRVPFLASAVLVLVGLYVRLQLVETPAFRQSVEHGERVRVPFFAVLGKYPASCCWAHSAR